MSKRKEMLESGKSTKNRRKNRRRFSKSSKKAKSVTPEESRFSED